MRWFFPVVIATVVAVAVVASVQEKELLSRSKRQARSQSVRARARRRSNVNVENIRSTSIQIGFNYISGAKGYFITAKEYSEEEGKVTQTVATSEKKVDEHKRQATLTQLHPGRNYLIEVQALNRADKLIGSRASGVVKTALRCFVCDGRASNNDCKGPSTILECPRGTDSCLNELRYQNGLTTVTKRCTQYRPEFATKFRGGVDATEACQGTIARDSFCFCACKSDLCNAQELPCATRCFPELKPPRGGSVDCTDGNRGDSVCTWKCERGRNLIGVDTSICRKDGTWSVITPPKCVARMPRKQPNRIPFFQCPELNNPKNGKISCTSANQRGSVCSVSCNNGYELTGRPSRRTCSSSGKWTPSTSKCTKITCPIINRAKNRVMTCTDGNRLASVCEFSCREKYTLAGEDTLTCGQNGRWSKSPPKCRRQGCFLRPRTPSNVLSDCEDLSDPEEGAICRYSCKVGYKLQGDSTQRCANSKWIGDTPSCIRLKCNLVLPQPQFGYIQCSDDQFVNSVCSFRCQNGFALIGRPSVTCLPTEQWSSRPPKCRRIRCEPIGEYSDGSYSCNNANGVGSVCSFRCNTGYGLPRRSKKRITCRAPSGNVDPDVEYPGKWSNPISRCEKARCTDRSLTNGLSRSCTSRDHREVGSVCSFRCIPGYYVAGRTRIQCLRNRFGYSNGRWLTDNPICIRRQCDNRVVPSGSLNCTDGRFAGSKCTVVCDYGYQVTGDPDVECQIDGRWNRRVPLCARVVCLEKDLSQFRLRNLEFSCGRPQQSIRGVNRYFVDHQCSLRCRAGYHISGGNTSACDSDGRWNVEDITCDDINECDTDNGGCQQNCTNVDGSFLCTCRENYKLEVNGKFCLLTVCPELKQNNHQEIDCSNGNLIGSRCSLTCIVGYELRLGPSLLTCKQDGTWSKSQGKCRKIRCSLLENPMHGSLSCSNRNVFQSRCSSSCDEGYELVGEGETECMSSKTWSNPLPKCRKIRCLEEGTKIVHGRAECTDNNFFQSRCRYFCNPGFEYENTEGQNRVRTRQRLSSTCRSDSTWSIETPRCVKSSCTPTVESMIAERPNSAVSCTEGNLFESVCTMVCQIGYQVNGPKRITCTEFQTWSRNLGRCEKVQCSEYAPLHNGDITCTASNFYRSQCTFRCEEGYNLIGSAITTCTSDRTWNRRRPRCQIVQCDESQTSLKEGTISCTAEHFFGSVCSLRCNPGYRFDAATAQSTSGFASRGATDVLNYRCLATGLWSSVKPTCVKHSCVPRVAAMDRQRPNGRISCTNGERFLSVCRLRCEEGYEIVGGSESAQCTETRQWSHQLGQCRRVQCQTFEEFENGLITCTNGNSYQSTCNFDCLPGYDLIGPSSSTCQSDRTFNNRQPYCRKIECPENHTILINGNATCSDGSRYESRCVYVCNPGFEMIGVATSNIADGVAVLMCMADRTWGGSLPRCRRKRCSINDGALTKAAQNGVVSCTEKTFFRSVCEVTCKEGYQLIGPSRTRCTATADWAPTIGYCQKIKCPKLDKPLNGAMTCTDENTFKSVCTFQCNFGYERIGSNSSICQSDRTFSNEEPTCREITCPVRYTTLRDGEALCTNSNKFASRCEYTCNSGYELTASSVPVAVCLSSYRWDATEAPACTKIRCSQADPIILTALERGSVSCTDENRFQSQCSLACNIGYELTEGEGVTVCQADQMWRDTFGICRKIRCPSFDEFANGGVVCSNENKYQSTCSFTCDAGYELIGSKDTVCEADRRFSNPLPECQKITCSEEYLSIANGTTECSEENLFQSVCEYRCAAGYEITAGGERTRCEDDRSWSQEKAVCEKKICPSDDPNLARADLNGVVTCTEGHMFNSICSVSCNAGYELFGGLSEKTRCNENAQWDSTIGYCIKIRCPEFDSLLNGMTTCSDSNKFLSSCEFKCNSGHEMAGSPLSTCQADGTWSSPLPECSKVRCSADYLSLDHGSVSCSDANRYQSTCSYDCVRGYEVAESDITSATCQAIKTWSNPKPTCSKIKCRLDDPNLLRAGSTGTVRCSDDNLFGSTCSVECPIGYELIEGANNIVCLDTAKWNRVIGHCQKIQCLPLAIPDNGEMECSDANYYQSRCSFACNVGYYMIGNDLSICQANKTYTSPTPACEKISCPTGHLNIRLGSVNCSETNLFGSVCVYECDTGYQFLDSDFVSQNTVEAKCLSNEQWNIEVPICEKKTCPVKEDENFLAALNQGKAGSVSCNEGSRFGSVCQLKCAPGFSVDGNRIIECTEEGRWNASIGICTVIECPARDEPIDGSLNCTDNFNFETECEFTCDEGHQFIEEFVDRRILRDDEGNFIPLPSTIRAECTEERTWTVVHTPQCEKKLCPLEGWDNLNNGNVSCSDGNVFMSTCFYQCDAGYQLAQPRDDMSTTSVLVTCTSSGLWDLKDVPMCIRRPCFPNATSMQEMEEHGTITCTGSDFESRCALECNGGYYARRGLNSSVCQSDGEWSVAIEPCEKIECIPLETPAYSTVTCTNSHFFKSHCKVNCDDGYEVIDPEEEYDQERGISCRSDGTWCGELPECSKITCPRDHLELSNGAVECTDSNVFESVCSYTCEQGFYMIQGQSDTSTCTNKGLWSSTVPICENNRCPANDSSLREAQENGEVTCTNENKFGSKCLLHCYDGYEMTGEYTASCEQDGTWSNGLGLCRRISCPALQTPENTTLMCTDGYRFQSYCVFKCLPGYKRSDEASEELSHDVTCDADGSWTGAIRYCEKLTCQSQGYEVVENGRVSCSDHHNFASECLFICNPGYQLVDRFDKDVVDPSVRCTTDGSWSMNEAPRCIPSECFPTAEEMDESIENGELSCTRSSEFGSRCKLVCSEGYSLDGEYSFTDCEANNAWWPPLGRCKKIGCSPMPLPPNVEEIQCSDDNNFGSACFVSRCRSGYRARNPGRNLRTCTEQRHWSGSELECSEFIECSTSHLVLENGNVVCSDGKQFGSQCDYYCHPSYQISTNRDRATCQANGEWSIVKPSCVARTTCVSTYFSLGIVHCNTGGSCRLICDPGTTLVGPRRSQCSSRSGNRRIRWIPPLGECRKRSCPAQTQVENGEFRCSDGFLFRSICRFRCNSGYQLSGSETTTCTADGVWENQPPTCTVVSCLLNYLELERGAVAASNTNNAGSDLTFSCTQEGYELIGSSEVTCLHGGQWNEPKPICRLGRCPPLHLLNGRVVCDKSAHNEYGSQCRYMCDELYQLQGESNTTECGFNGKWSSPRPYCRGHCDTNLAEFENGVVFCTDSHWHNSKCSFSCGNIGALEQPFQLYGSSELTCQKNGRWNEPPPCCSKPCPPSGKIDMFFVLDSSDSVGYGNWTKVLTFVNQIVSSFNVGYDDLLVGVVRYHRDVAVRDEIRIGEYRVSSDLRHAIRFLNYGGFGTNTGRALSHVTRSSLKAVGKRPDAKEYVILITDGASQDDISIPSQQLKESGPTVYTVGVAGSRLNRDQLDVIATSSDHVFIADNGFDDLTPLLVENITGSMCQNPCLFNEKYRENARYYLT